MKRYTPRGHARDVPLLSELDETDLMQPGRPGLGGREVPGLVFGDSVEDGVPLALVHDGFRSWQQYNVLNHYCHTAPQT